FLFLHVGNINDLRLHAGYFSDFEVYAVIIVMFNKEFGLELSARKRKIALIVIGFSALMYLARTNMIQFVILWMAMKGYLAINKKSLTLIASLVIFSAV